ncbi:site-specific integrase [Mesorhizobium sp. LNJC394B00]|uniref:tyrosine-type recombinase/integrase n=1 Tax=Mesorhizobium sp. LNJC394B00 TaxID=1287274 RepID=UPI0003CE961D|nr:site-specific integrase [Mesorhizobium sp. LNJC394B00]ESY21385.1 integrase [Mesorhizobium sp. LNJC394B00]
MPLKLYRRPGGEIWHYRGTVAGRRIRGTTETEDKTRAQRIAAERERREWTRHLDGPGATLTFADAAIAYREAGKPTRFLEAVEDHWKDTPIREITENAVRRASIKLYPMAGPATRNRQAIVPTQAVINFCAEEEWCPRLRVRRFKVNTKIKDPATLAWVTAFVANASPHLGALCMFMFATGARVGEAVSVEWTDVDLNARTVKIRQTKVGAERIAHLPPQLVAALSNIPSNRNPEDRVFRYVSRESVRQVWDAAIKRAGIKKLSPHSCRHGFATTMLQSGIDVKTVAKLGGWKDVATLVKTYAHAMSDLTLTNVIFGTNLAQPENSRVVRG